MSEMFPHNPLRFEAGSLSKDDQIALYGKLLLPRMIEEKMMSQLRQGKISKWFSGMGQEAISVGVAAARPEDKFIFPMHRNLGIFTTRNVPSTVSSRNFKARTMGSPRAVTAAFTLEAPSTRLWA